jgi:hypothetical protein
MNRPRWHDVVISLGILSLAVVGVVAIWGDNITEWFANEDEVLDTVQFRPEARQMGPEL